ncbi:MAG: (deoxy)nucleoside triphosphate pyrophosphohydrolase, partial [Salinimicrobium sp.]
NLPLKWEFPGGKVEQGEEFESCLIREIKEELGVEINVIERLPSNKHHYADQKTIELIPFRCSLQTSEIHLKEHRKIEWVPIQELNRFDWAEADIPIVQYYMQKYQ